MVAHIWGYYQEIQASKIVGGMAAAALTFVEIKAWSELMGVKLYPWEVDALRRLDSVWHEVNLEKSPGDDSGKGNNG